MTAKKAKKDEAKKLAVEAARLAEQNKCEDIVVLDLRGRSPITDYFVIATGTSGRQMRTVAEELKKYGQGAGTPPWQIAGMESQDWIVLDFVDVIVHLFDGVHRKYYDLEMMWGEGPKVRWRKRTTKKASDEDEA